MYKVNVKNGQEFKLEYQQGALLLNGEPFGGDISQLNENQFHVLHNDQSLTVKLIAADYEKNEFKIQVNGNTYELTAKDKMTQLLESLGMNTQSSQKVNELKAPMPGLVLEVNTEEGAEVQEGDKLLILEAMKMENVIKSPVDGTIGKINVSVGESVAKNSNLISFG